MRTVLVGGLAIILVAAGSAQTGEKIDARRLVGKWGPKEPAEGAAMVIEYTRDGKVIMTAAANGLNQRVEGTYKLAGNVLTQTMRPGSPIPSTKMTVLYLETEQLALAKEGESVSSVILTRVKGK